MKLLVELAYNVDEALIRDMPRKEDSMVYDIEAESEGDVPITYELLQPQLQRLLHDRFHFMAHRETEDRSGYALVVAKSGPKVKVAGQTSIGSYILPDKIRIPNGSMDTFARTVARVVGQPVEDQANLTGTYEFDLKYAPMNAVDSPLPSIFTSLKEQLGLELKPRKVPVEVLVIDHVDQMPTEN